jgi:3-dehydroquinate synthase
MSQRNAVSVRLAERSYTIGISTNQLLEQLDDVAAQVRPWKHAVLIVDQKVESIGERIRERLESLGVRSDVCLVPSGESSKSVAQIASLWESMLEHRTDRKSVVVAIGGGVIGDLAGFAAASYMRGLRFLQIPTTLLAMVDSSVGGKTGINLPKSKNVIGAFWQPHAVCIDTSVLESLPDREYRSGLAEVVKYGVILDAKLFEYLEANQQAILQRVPQVVQHIVQRSCELKADVVSADERETTGLRAILNYGHTFGHAIEATTDYGRYLHGEAISIGMTMAGQLAVDRNLWTRSELERQTTLLSGLGLPVRLESNVITSRLIEAMRLDKKTEHGVFHLILPTKIGQVESRNDSPVDRIMNAIDCGR